MKSKSVIIALALSILGSGSAFAATGITGDIYGKVFRSMDMSDAGALFSVTIDDLNVPGESCDNMTQTCHLRGFSWSDVVGWTAWDGESLQTDLGAASFPDEYIAKIAYNGNVGGFIWGEKYGWIQLNVCSGLSSAAACTSRSYCNWSGTKCEISNVNRLPAVASQNIDNWGVYLDFCPLKLTQAACENVVDGSATYCNWDSDVGENTCVFDKAANQNGQPFYGFAWSQYLGWIKFGTQPGEFDFTGAFTNWFPDLTPPVFRPYDTLSYPVKAWIPNDSINGTIEWLEFVDENDSFVDLLNSTIRVTTDPSADFAGCPVIAGGPFSNGDLVISLGGTGEAHLAIPQIGKIGTPPHGFCKYELDGVLYNASGFGFYFGPEGLSTLIANGYNPADPTPNVYEPNPVTLFVRAGDLVPSSISLTSSGNNGLADGDSSVLLSFGPRDIGDNPIVTVYADLEGNLDPVDPADRVRSADLLYDLSTSRYTFDSISWLRDVTLSNPIPVVIEGLPYLHSDDLQFPQAGIGPLTPFAGNYLMDLKGFAPTPTLGSDGNHLELDSIQINTNDLALPAVSPMQGPWPANNTPLVLASAPTFPFNYRFNPLLEVTGGTLDTSFLSLNQPAQATFSYINNSPFEILNRYNFDNVMTFYSTGTSSELIEVVDINLITLSDTPGRTDPYAPGAASRYGLLYNTAESEGQNQFHSTFLNYHNPEYSFETEMDPVSGIYKVPGNAYVSPGDPCLAEPIGTCGWIDIDRTDYLAFTLPLSATDDFTFTFTPSRYLSAGGSGQISFDIYQYLSYHAQANHYLQSPVYWATPYIENVQVKTIGFETSGTVGGQQVYDTASGRDLATVSTSYSADLRREIRRNVAVLTRNMTACTPETLATLPITASDCVAKDETNKTIVAFYKAPASGVITLGDGSATPITIPDGYRYTMIFDAVNLDIENNIIYQAGGSANTSFGIIVMQDSDGKGGNVYLDPKPTNIVGLLYAEGSLLSSADAGATLYYAAGGPSVGDLSNQLYWQGSIASRNTIGGASTTVIPENVDCNPWPDNASCSQAHDFDFTRRFTTISQSGVEFAPDGYKFSGGGSCVSAPSILCTLGLLPTTVTLTSGTINVTTSKSLDTFFIERDNRPVPPGFSSKGGLTSSQVIR